MLSKRFLMSWKSECVDVNVYKYTITVNFEYADLLDKHLKAALEEMEAEEEYRREQEEELHGGSRL